MRRLENCYYGQRQVIYVTITTVDRKTSRNLSVYGHTHEQVIQAVDSGLTQAFGRVGTPGRRGRRRKKLAK